jgi:phytanoyl-CoA hydroxylase
MNKISKFTPVDPASIFDREAFLADGYFVARGIIDTGLLDQINQEIASLFEMQLGRLGLKIDTAQEAGGAREAFQNNAERLLQADVKCYIDTARLTQMFPSANQLMICEALVELSKAAGVEYPVISTRVSNHIMSDRLKIPGGYHKSPPHQDWRSMQGSLDSVVIWIPTTPVSLQSHPLEVARGSHLMGLLDTAHHIQTPMVDDPRITEDSFTRLQMEPGDAVIFSSFLVHRTGEQGDGLVRIAYSTRFNNALESTWVGHGYPTPYKYSYQTELIVPGFPKGRDLAKIFPAALIED